ncbi:MAG: phenylalanine 4-monooxygenase, partial [Rhodanobacteraceae bacterium]
IMRAQYRIDTFQQTYFVIDDFKQLMDATQPDFTPIYDRLAKQSDVPAREVLDSDKVIHRGTREGFARDADA